MRTIDITPAEMSRYHAKSSELTPVTQEYLEREGIPVEAYQMTAAKTILNLLGPKRPGAGAGTRPAIEVPPGVSVFIVESPPHDGPALHAHVTTVETFLCLQGRYEIKYGPTGEHSLVLEPFDTVAVPAGVMRQFVNLTDETARLLVLIHEPDGEQALGDLYLLPELGEEITEKFGASAREGLERIGMQFTANEPD